MKPVSLDEILSRIEIRYLKKALRSSNFIRGKAAKLLGLNRTTFVMKLKKYKLYQNHPSPLATKDRGHCIRFHEYENGSYYLVRSGKYLVKRCKLCLKESRIKKSQKRQIAPVPCSAPLL